jgi:hypothetical protein
MLVLNFCKYHKVAGKKYNINLLNAELNPSCKSQLAKFFWVGI